MAESADHNQKNTPEWTHFVEAEDMRDKVLSLHISPDKEEVKNLERRLGLEAIESLKADITVKRDGPRAVKVSGKFVADVVQRCVVTLLPVKDHVEDSFEAWFADHEQAVSFVRARHVRDKDMGQDERPMLEEYEDPEPIIDGRINVAEVVTQYLSLALNPYPHSDEAKEKMNEINEQQEIRDNPFAALKTLKDKK